MTRPENTSGAYFGGLNNVLKATRTDDLPPVERAYESVASAADREMIAVLAEDRRRRAKAARVERS